MDMKRILQALDSTAAETTSDSNSMKKFMSIVSEDKTLESAPVVESKQPSTKKLSSGVDVYFEQVEAERAIKETQKTRAVKDLAEAAVHRMGGSRHHTSKFHTHLSKSKKLSPSIRSLAMKHSRFALNSELSGVDSVTLDSPLFIRLLEYAREDAQSDAELHSLVERAIQLSDSESVLSMDDYSALVNNSSDDSIVDTTQGE